MGEIVYKQSISARVVRGIVGIVVCALTVGTYRFALLELHRNPPQFLVMCMGGMYMAYFGLCSLLRTGLRELRIWPSEGFHVYRVCAAVRWPFIKPVTDATTKSLLGLPWKVAEYHGKIHDIAGIQWCDSTDKGRPSHALFLCWRDPSRPPVRVGFSFDKSKAGAVQQALAKRLGVPVMPDQIAP